MNRFSKILISLFLAFLGFNQCSNPTEDKPVVPEIDLSKDRTARDYPLDSIAKAVYYTELESNTDSFIGEVSDIVFSRNFILVLDQKLFNILLFNSNGQFVRKIGQRGQGPGEYGTPFSIDVSEDEEFLFIYSTGDKILQYTINGDFLRNISTKATKMHYFASVDHEFVFTVAFPLATIYGSYTFGVMDSNGRIKNTALYRKYPKNMNIRGMICNTSFYSIGDTIVYWQYIYDTVYAFTPKYKLAPRWVIDYGDNKVPSEAFGDIASLNSAKRAGKFMVNYFLESNNHVFITAIGNRMRELIILDKRNHELFNLKPIKGIFYGLNNNIDSGPPFWPQYLVNDSTMARVIEPGHLISMRLEKDLISQISSPEFLDIVERATVNSNHIIMKVILK